MNTHTSLTSSKIIARLFSATLAILMAAGIPASSLKAEETTPETELNVTDILSLKERLNSYEDALPDKDKLGMNRIIAYDESRDFTYVLGTTSSSVRRIVCLKPSTLIISDVLTDDSKPGKLVLRTKGKTEISKGRIRIGDGESSTICETVVPTETEVENAQDDNAVEVSPRKAYIIPFIYLLYPDDDKDRAPSVRLTGTQWFPVLEIKANGKLYTLALPPEQGAPGTVSITKDDGEEVLARRLLASGILPHGRGAKMVEGWDRNYHNNKRPPWDTWRVANELKRVVENGAIKPCRAVVLGCGTGTNARYLADEGFDVTAIELAPTALVRATARSAETGSVVRWMLADVLNPPDMKPFDFIFDRGCYHNVRKHDAAGFVKALCKMSHPGTSTLIIAGSAKEGKRRGPPMVKEEDIRKDFSSSFEFTWLNDIRFDLGMHEPMEKGPMAWSIMLEKK
ncbi:MAG: class I SAM-dependent methyltransferase [Kiritimatiellia bacterium]|jgi:SAM-dependent methyltransferase|nr:class I SAM-dependent methyltransferase [Kiritimatiellia bacterium]